MIDTATDTRADATEADKDLRVALARAIFAASKDEGDTDTWPDGRDDSLKTARRVIRRLEAAGYKISKDK